MRFVLDASVALRWVLPSSLTPKSLQLRDELQRKIHDLIAPSIFSGEIPNALTKAERQRLIPVGHARRLITDVLSTPPRLVAYEPLIYRATDISSRMRCGFYDCLYVALAEKEGIELITADDKLVNALQITMPFVISLASLP